MDQLELRFYPRAEIAEALQIKIEGNRNFGRDVETKLSNAGYCCEYKSRQGVYILSKPETPEERLSEILYRGYGINIQIHAEEFACFIAAFTDIEGFESMPWAERAAAYYTYYGICVSDKTLRNWCSQLIDRGVIAKMGGSTRWRTYFEGNRKIREPIEEIDVVEMENYFERRSELFKNHYIDELESGLPPRVARKAAWKQTYIDLWGEFGVCYYYCKTFTLTAFSYNDVDVREIYELVTEIAAVAPPPMKARSEAPPTKEFTF